MLLTCYIISYMTSNQNNQPEPINFAVEELDLLRPINSGDPRGFISQYDGNLFFKPAFFNQAGGTQDCLFSPSIQLHCIRGKVAKVIDELDLAIKKVEVSWIPETDKTELTNVFNNAKITINNVVSANSYGFNTHNREHVNNAETKVKESLRDIKTLIKDSLQNKEAQIAAKQAAEAKIEKDLILKVSEKLHENSEGDIDWDLYGNEVYPVHEVEQEVDWRKTSHEVSKNAIDVEL